MMNAVKEPMAIFTQRLAGFLMLNGFILIGTEPSRNNPRKNIFFFNDSPRLREYMEEYKKRTERQKRANHYDR